MFKKIFFGLLFVFLTIQFIRPDKNLSASPAGPDDLATRHAVPPEVRHILETSCYDCHSNHTRYPWYAAIQPISWWLNDHISEGKHELNFSEFGSYTQKRQAKKLQALCDEITEHGMPLKSYTLLHRDAQLSDAQIKTLCDWADTLRQKIASDK